MSFFTWLLMTAVLITLFWAAVSGANDICKGVFKKGEEILKDKDFQEGAKVGFWMWLNQDD